MSSENQAKALALIPKVSGPLSIFGSCWILYEILIKGAKKQKWKKPYHRLLLSMCVLDVLSSICLALSTWPIPASTSDRWGASGNEATCKAQAFFIQANIASPIFNFMLSLFFLIRIKYQYTDQQISKFIEPIMQATTLTFGLGTSAYCLAMDLFADSSLWCWINATPKGCYQTFQYGYTTCETGDDAGIYRWAFFFAPLWACAIGSMIIMAMLYHFVRQTESKKYGYDFEYANIKRMVEQDVASEQMQQQQQQQQRQQHDGSGGDDINNNNQLDDDEDVDYDDDEDYDDEDDSSNSSQSFYSQVSGRELQSPSSSRTPKNTTARTAGAVRGSIKFFRSAVATPTIHKNIRKELARRKRKQQQQSYRRSKMVAHQAYRYVGVFYITWIAGTINRLLQLINGKSFYWIMVLHAIFTPLQGFFNFLVYMYPKWKKKYQQRKRRSKRELLEGRAIRTGWWKDGITRFFHVGGLFNSRESINSCNKDDNVGASRFQQQPTDFLSLSGSLRKTSNDEEDGYLTKTISQLRFELCEESQPRDVEVMEEVKEHDNNSDEDSEDEEEKEDGYLTKTISQLRVELCDSQHHDSEHRNDMEAMEEITESDDSSGSVEEEPIIHHGCTTTTTTTSSSSLGRGVQTQEYSSEGRVTRNSSNSSLEKTENLRPLHPAHGNELVEASSMFAPVASIRICADVNQQEPLYPSFASSGGQKDWRKYLLQGNSN